ncbi:bifunctional precorrin-2 dehydrogenase/sirohydrochlorin ferrochelatase [Nitrosopumilus sp.]|uniref:precorrin-2 dehydrogenase/sirohydrochlorin ferrochelatase family protein n=1 Tax=Nitrosopumilus sp. TaxID=2024843 RepID=UPI002603869D|nr:bifunctional precorrin-2 dehydrogenase/sirohydrochlorin ferrochelatase [Nitrosopumilus sp.]
MIVDLNLQSKKVVVIGGGKEAEKRIASLLKEKCQITVFATKINSSIKKLANSKKIKIKKQNISNTKFIAETKPDLIITTTDDKKINEKIIRDAKKKKIIVYSSDNPDKSDFANPAIIDFEKIIQIAIFTGGQSPAMSKKLRIESEKIFKKIIKKEDIGQIKIQKIARGMAKDIISNQQDRKNCLRSIMTDNEIDQLIKDGQLKKAEKRAVEILRNWK